MKKILFAFALLVCVFIRANAQDTARSQAHRIAIFAPLYLDSAFGAGNEYKYARNAFPKFINPGLEFYEGAQLALDSLRKTGMPLEVYVYDTRSVKEKLPAQLEDASSKNVELIIAHCSGNELRPFSELAMNKQIPVISTSIPSDGGNTANPYFVVLNPTLKTQVDGIAKYVQSHFAKNPLIVFRKKGVNEDYIKSYLEDFSKNNDGIDLKFKYVDLVDSFQVKQLTAALDSNKHFVCISGTLDANFGRRLAQQLASVSKSYPVSIIGMPTWDGIKDFSKSEFKGVEIIYSNPFYNAKTDKVSVALNNFFNNVIYARPSDMVYRGYEVTWKFSKLLQAHSKDFASNLGNKEFKVFTDFDIQPVLSKGTMTLQYFENKKLYFVKWMDGIIKSVY